MTKTRRFLWILSWIGLFILSQLPTTAFGVLRFLGASPLVVNLTIAGLAIVVLTVFILLAKKAQLISFKLSWFRLKDLGILLLGELGILFTSIVGSTVMSLLDHVRTTTNQASINQMLSPDTLFPMGILIVLLAPILEEILFRGIIPQKIFHGHEKWGYLLGWLLFTLLHTPSNLGSFIVYGGMSAILTYLAYRSQRLEMSIFLHMIQNSLGYIIMLIATILQLSLS